MIGWVVFLVIFILVVVGTIVLIYRLSKVNMGGVSPNAKLLCFFGTNNSRGHALGVELVTTLSEAGSSDTKIVKFKPLDVPYNKRGKPIKCENVELAVRRNLMVDVPSGANSLHRNICYVFPGNVADISPELRNHPFGQALAFNTQYLNFTDKAIKIAQDKDISEKEALSLLMPERDQMVNMYKQKLDEMLNTKIAEHKENKPTP